MNQDNNVKNIFERAIHLHQHGNIAEAEKLYRQVLNVYPEHPDANHNLGVALATSGRLESSLQYFKAAYLLQKDNAQFIISYVQSLSIMKLFDKARSVLEAARALGVWNEVLENLQKALIDEIKIVDTQSLHNKNSTQNNKSRKEPKPKKQQQIVSLITSGRLVEAETILKDLVAKYPNSSFLMKALGVFHHHKGELDVSIEYFRRSIQIDDKDLSCYLLYGNVLRLRGRLNDALEAYKYAQLQNPKFAETYYEIGNIYKLQGNYHDALSSYEQALKLKYNYYEALNGAGIVFHDMQDYTSAIKYYNNAISINPNIYEIYNNRGLSNFKLNNYEDALKDFDRALSINHKMYQAFNNKGLVYMAMGEFSMAISSFDNALSINSVYYDALINKGVLLRELRQYENALNCFNKTIEINPEIEDGYLNKAIILKDTGKLSEALQLLKNAIAINPKCEKAYHNMGMIFADLSKFELAMECLNKSMPLMITAEKYYSNLLFVANYNPNLTETEIYHYYSEFDSYFSYNVNSDKFKHACTKDAKRKLKIGYISPDFKQHSVKYFLLPFLSHHDLDQFEIFAYAEAAQVDDVTSFYKTLVNHWIPTKGLSDHQLAQQIHQDQIDILVDLAGHTVGNRLRAFSLKPAPIQVTWLGYACTTGLRSIDYFLCDEMLAPKGCEHVLSETPWRIKRASLVYRPEPSWPSPNSLPALTNGYVTFGCLSRAIRINDNVVKTWSALLHQVANSRLIVDSMSFDSSEMCEYFKNRFTIYGISPDRILAGFNTPSWKPLQSIDIMLDCFPHNSGTTLAESLYMGVPFVTYAHRPTVGRVGSMLLTATGYDKWIACNESDYILKAVELASDLETLSTIRHEMRSHLKNSELFDEAGLTREIESAYREMWERWRLNDMHGRAHG